jgi:hypothetical protein
MNVWLNSRHNLKAGKCFDDSHQDDVLDVLGSSARGLDVLKAAELPDIQASGGQ